MKKLLKRSFVIFACFSILLSGLTAPASAKADEGLKSHAVTAGESADEAPLRGFVQYESSNDNFPHSMEYFDIPVNAVQTGMDTYDWSALESKLNKISGRGNQAIFRFYYDNPAGSSKEVKSGIPSFLNPVNADDAQAVAEFKSEHPGEHMLEVYHYDGTTTTKWDNHGISPNYHDEVFQQSMINFIKAFGKKYDNDPRIAFISVGFLGFYGEWHLWPYEDKKDASSRWHLPVELKQKVLDTYMDSFTHTKLLLREPKEGLDFSKLRIGFNDDMFTEDTLGPSSSHFVPKLNAYGLGDVWKTECIGGEVVPAWQKTLFEKEPVQYSGGYLWDDCVDKSHATWMLCSKMKEYTGSELEIAKKCAKMMGYDLRVTEALYNDTSVGADMTFGINMTNIGVAPFYYGHETWPVDISFIQNGKVIKTCRTSWDINKVLPGEKVSFTHQIKNVDVNTGTYQMAIKVVSPLKGGVAFSFANKGVNGDGWLIVGDITVSEKKTTTEAPEVTETPGATEAPEATETPGATETPETTEAPGATDAPEVPETTESPEATEAPEVTEAPAVPETPTVPEKPVVPENPVVGAEKVSLNGEIVGSFKEAISKMNEAKEYTVLLDSDVYFDKNFIMPAAPAKVTINGNGHILNIRGNKLTAGNELKLENVRVRTLSKKGGLAKLTLTAKRNLTIGKAVDFTQTTGTTIKCVGELRVDENVKVNNLTAGNVVLSKDADLIVDRNSKVIIKYLLKGEGGNIVLGDGFNKPISLKGDASGNICLKGKKLSDGTRVINANKNKLSPEHLLAVFDVKGITDNSWDTGLYYLTPGKVCIFGSTIGYGDKTYGVWKDVRSAMNADIKNGASDLKVVLSGDVNAAGVFKMPVKGYNSITIEGAGHEVKFRGSLKLTGNTTFSSVRLHGINAKGADKPFKLVVGSFLLDDAKAEYINRK